jgi:hypothetical protein
LTSLASESETDAGYLLFAQIAGFYSAPPWNVHGFPPCIQGVASLENRERQNENRRHCRRNWIDVPVFWQGALPELAFAPFA